MKNYIIASLNSAGVLGSYFVDDKGQLLCGGDLDGAQVHLKALHEEGPQWADYRVIELVVVE